jgi:hypothetical protein
MNYHLSRLAALNYHLLTTTKNSPLVKIVKKEKNKIVMTKRPEV